MAAQILQNVKFYVSGYDLSGDMNSVSVDLTAEGKDATVFGCSGRKRKGGLKDCEIRIGGFHNASTGLAFDNSSDAVDPVIYNNLGDTGKIVSIVPNGTAVGTTANNKAYFGRGIVGNYNITGNVGEMLGFAGGFVGDRSLIRGYLMCCSSLLSTGTAVTIKKVGLKGPTKNIYCAVHVLDHSSAGASIKLHVEQSSSTTFALGNATSLTMTLTSAHVGTAQWGSTILGSTLDHSFRVVVTSTLVASSALQPKFKAVVVLGIQK